MLGSQSVALGEEERERTAIGQHASDEESESEDFLAGVMGMEDGARQRGVRSSLNSDDESPAGYFLRKAAVASGLRAFWK